MTQTQTGGMSIIARLYVAAVILAGAAAILLTFYGWTPDLRVRFVLYLLITVASSGMKVTLPGIEGTMSVNYIFTLLALLELDRPQVVLLALVSTLVQTFWHTQKPPRPVQFVFNLACMALTVVAASAVFEQPWFGTLPEGEAIRLAIAGMTYFCVNTFCISIVIGLTERRAIQSVWKSSYLWIFPFYLVGVSLAELAHSSIERLGWRFTIAVVPLLYVIYRTFRLYIDNLQQEKTHNADMANLHLRTIEALAMAIEAKDECTQDHLRRVQVYSEKIAQRMDLPEERVQALRTAAILHDIGKLAVPDYIISKPGKLTPEEFDKVKIHTVVGAAILERVGFPYAVSPIVHSHHEKWDGTGYPDGLKGEEIPIEARILSAVDCLDALASDRQYRKALPLDEAMEYVASMAGRSFDPRVVDVLKRHYQEFESLAAAAPLREKSLGKHVEVRRGDAPDAGFQNNQQPPAAVQEVFLASIVSARQEVQAILELSQDLSGALRLDEILSVVAERLRKLVPFDGMAVFVREGDLLRLRYVHGEGCPALASAGIPLGQGLSGWVVENHKPILNGNPAVEGGNWQDAGKAEFFRAALSVPLSAEDLSGAMTLYHSGKDAYNKEHLRILLAIGDKIARAIQGSLRFQQAQHQASTDELTGLPNARSLCLHIQEELMRAKVTLGRGAVLVCDLDGFKSVNDNFGHLAGNEILHRVARILQANCRVSDYVGRLGGDEFVMLLGGATAKDLERRVSEIDRMVRAAGLEICGKECVGISIGCAYFPDDGSDAETLLSRADHDMYRAKGERKASRENVFELPSGIVRVA
ncbi:MAG: HD domain-containing phosphohydrolase [Bryobacteraceae bacterium]|jgi:diguanylate cyclase (GGDEF)-like protein/putative nucleotidyltransferase with HDIG domain